MSFEPIRHPRRSDGRFVEVPVKIPAPPVPMSVPRGFTGPSAPVPGTQDVLAAYRRMQSSTTPPEGQDPSLDAGPGAVVADDWSCPDCGTDDPARRYPPPTTVKRCKNCQRYYNLSVNSRKERRDGHAPGISFSRDEFLAWISGQQLRCALCGIEEPHVGQLDLKSSIGRRVVALGIDRIDNAAGYEFSNMQLCCYACNKAKGNVFSGDEARTYLGGQIAKAWTERALGDQSDLQADDRCPLQMVTVMGAPSTCPKCGYCAPGAADKCMACYKFRSISRNAEKTRVHNNTPGLGMTAREFGEWMTRQTLRCSYCGIDEAALHQLDVKTSVGHTLVYLGIDRVDNERGYTGDNIVFCCYACNKAKGNVFSGPEMDRFVGPGISFAWQDRIFSDRNPFWHPHPGSAAAQASGSAGD